MATLGAVASIITLLQVATSLAKHGAWYASGVWAAKKEAVKLKEEAGSLVAFLNELQSLLRRPYATNLLAIQTLLPKVDDSLAELSELEQKIGKHVLDSHSKLSDLKWPFVSKDLEKTILSVTKWRNTFESALQIDQTTLILDLAEKLEKQKLGKLPYIRGALYDSYEAEFERECHSETRVKLRRQILAWADNSDSKCIFWLCGMAGTGKSTLSRTIAGSLSVKGQLGASFFFKRDEADRRKAALLVPTLVHQLIRKVPEIIPGIFKALDEEPEIATKGLEKQFKHLLVEPLKSITPPSSGKRTLAIVIDALDECDRQPDIETLVKLFPLIKDLPSLNLRIFLTSRPEIPVWFGFRSISSELHQDLALHEISERIVKHDLFIFLTDELKRIGTRHSLPTSWPDSETTQKLASTASPLFIYAASICRFIDDGRFDPRTRLTRLLSQSTKPGSQMDNTYSLILGQLLSDLDDDDQQSMLQEFRDIVGPVVTLFSPLPIGALAKLLSKQTNNISIHLQNLQSVIHVPVNEKDPVRILHLSFRECLLDPKNKEKSPFSLNEQSLHLNLANSCIKLMSSHIQCNSGTKNSRATQKSGSELSYACSYWAHHLKGSGSFICDENPSHIFLRTHFIPWLEILGTTRQGLDGGLTQLDALQSILDPTRSVQLGDLVRDCQAFCQNLLETGGSYYSSALVFLPDNSIVKQLFKHKLPDWISHFPEIGNKLGSSPRVIPTRDTNVSICSIAFSPDGTYLATADVNGLVTVWKPKSREQLGSYARGLITFTSRSQFVFQPDNTLVIISERGPENIPGPVVTFQASLAGTATNRAHQEDIEVWKSTPEVRFIVTLKCSASGVLACVFKTSGNLFGVFTLSNGVFQVLMRQSSSEVDLEFSPDGRYILTTHDARRICIWDASTGLLLSGKGGFDLGIRLASICFSKGNELAVISVDAMIQFWEILSPEEDKGLLAPKLHKEREYKIKNGICTTLHSGLHLRDGVFAVMCSRGLLWLWNTNDANSDPIVLDQFKSDRAASLKLASSPNGKLLAAAYDGKIHLWDNAIEHANQANHSNLVPAVSFKRNKCCFETWSVSPSSKYLAWESNEQIHLLCLPANKDLTPKVLAPGIDLGACTILFSPDDFYLAVATRNNLIIIWNPEDGHIVRSWLVGEASSDNAWPKRPEVKSLAFSSDSKLLAVALTFSVEVYSVETGELLGSCKSFTGRAFTHVCFSDDGSFLATLLFDDENGSLGLWNIGSTFYLKRYLKLPRIGLIQETSRHQPLAFSECGSKLRIGEHWFDLNTKTLTLSNSLPREIEFGTDGCLLWKRRTELLWIPKEYRPLRDDWYFKDGILAIYPPEGQMLVMKFRNCFSGCST